MKLSLRSNLSHFKNKIIIFFNEIHKISELFDKKDLPLEFTFKDEMKQGVQILINPITHNDTKNLPMEEKITFHLKFFKKKNLVAISELDQPSLDVFLKQYEIFVNDYNTIDNNKQPKISLKSLSKFIKLNVKLLRNNFILRFFVIPGYVLDVYTINDYDKKDVTRTLIQSMDRINIINTEFIDSSFLLGFHRKNMSLINYIIQNNISLVSKLITFSFKIIVNFVRFWILFGGLLLNIINFGYHNRVIYDSIVNYDYFGVFTNLLLPILIPTLFWFATPRIVKYLIFKKKI